MKAAKETRLAAKNMSRFIRTEGKITHTLGLPVDEKMMRVVREAKEKKFHFNRWAREVLYARITEVTNACGIEEQEEASA
jgi:hypothetical protein